MNKSNETKRNNEFIYYFINGYLNYYEINLHRSRTSKRQYKGYKIESMLVYLGLPIKYKRFLEILSPLFLPLEFICSLFILLYKYVHSIIHTINMKKEMPVEKVIMLALDTPVFKLKQLLKCYPQERDIITVSIPFIKSDTPYESYSMYSGLRLKDCSRALILSIRLLVFIFSKYHCNDFLFRAYASYEFFLSCLYVEYSDVSNRFLYISTNDRWAYLFGNDTKHNNIFIQHGLLGRATIRYKAPYTAYYINKEQQLYLEQEVFIGKPIEVYYRPCLEFTSNDKIRTNGKPNLLVICCNKTLDIEKRIIPQLADAGRYNIYVKPHPGFKDHSEYYILKNNYDIVILDSEDFPHVDKVVSYDSALACEYEDVGVSVLRYNDTNFNEEFRLIVDKNKDVLGLSGE